MAGNLPKTRRRGRVTSFNPTQLPDELRSFDSWLHPNGIHDYMTALSRFVGGDQRLTPIMNAAGLSVADWYRQAMSKPTSDGSEDARGIRGSDLNYVESSK